MELSKIQKKIVESKEPCILVNSCAGSGKTRCLVHRLQHLLNIGIAPSKIVAITFTNAAAEEILERIARPTGLFVGTIHSYANQLLLMGGIDTADILDKEQFDKLFSRIKKHPDCIKEVEYLLLDEGQDSTAQQFEFVLETVNPKNWMIFSDHRQSIYRFAGATPDYILNLMDSPEVTTYDLTENYRNAPEILDFAKKQIRPLGIDYLDHSVPMREVSGRVITIDYSGEGIATTIKRYVAEGKSAYKDWFILTRTNAESEAILKVLARHKIPTDTFKKAQLDNKGLKQKMREDTVKVLTIHTAKGLEADNVVVIGARNRDIEEKCIGYVAATRARNLLVWTYPVNKRKPQTEYWGG